MKLITAPDPVPNFEEQLIPVFMGGSIEQGTAKEWQSVMIEALADQHIVLFNPRRPQWDPSWVQDESNPEFVQQVNWELDRIDEAMVVFLYFQADTKSPISLLELGIVSTQSLMSDDNMTVVVVCEPGFWRRGNVQIVCERAMIPVYSSLEEGIQAVKEDIEFWQISDFGEPQ